VLVSFAGARRGIETRRALGLSAGVVLVLLWAGDRSGAVSFVAAFLVVWTYTRGPLSRRLALPAALGLLLVMPTVGVLRQLPRNDVSADAIADAARAASPLAALTEMGASLRPLLETVQLVPAANPYRHGGSYGAAALRVVPNLGLATDQREWADPTTLPPNHWITYTVAPWTWSAFGGLGFSAVAEPYLNFGVAGIVAYFLVLGIVLGRIDAALARGLPRRGLALVAVVFMPLLVTVRNDFHNFARPAAWGAGLVLLLEQVHGVRRVQPAGRPLAPSPAAGQP
jgi:hypothetical protein